MKAIVPTFFYCIIFISSRAQKVDSIYFHLYTDSLKKGTYNYINVDGKLSNGQWLPLNNNKEIILSASAGLFDGNSLFIDTGFSQEKVTVKAVLKENPSLLKEITIYIKKKDDNIPLKNKDDLFNNRKNTKKRSTF